MLAFCNILTFRSVYIVLFSFQGHIDRMSSQTLVIRYLPCGPDKFQTCFQIQVAHFEPNTINIYGEGVFPRIILDLPRICDPCGKYSCLVQQAMENISLVTKKEQSMSEHSSENLYYPSMQPYVHHEPVDEVIVMVIRWIIHYYRGTEAEFQLLLKWYPAPSFSSIICEFLPKIWFEFPWID